MRILSSSRARHTAAALAILAIGAAVSACGIEFSTGVEAKEAWTRTYKVKPGATVELREPNGRIRVEATDGDEVAINATRVAKGPSDEAAKAALADVKISENASADRVEIDSNSAAGFSFRVSKRVDYDVKMPRNGQLTIKNTNGEIRVISVAGFVKIETTNGDIELTGIEKGADVSATNGRVQIELASVGDGGVRCKTTNGQIIVTVPANAKANIAARVINGIVHTENLEVKSTDSSQRRLDATIGGGGPEIRLETTNGEVRIVGK
ncbi:MAG TPA: DUF4097 family beta strand repeat-containing protein [Vicinamibacterales bacterium]|nr:DUF4097 family beta strand repeat-containing protein [Vicinamibacterales bacterium]